VELASVHARSLFRLDASGGRPGRRPRFEQLRLARMPRAFPLRNFSATKMPQHFRQGGKRCGGFFGSHTKLNPHDKVIRTVRCSVIALRSYGISGELIVRGTLERNLKHEMTRWQGNPNMLHVMHGKNVLSFKLILCYPRDFCKLAIPPQLRCFWKSY